MLRVIEFGGLEAEPEPQAKVEPAGMPLWEIGEGCSWPISQDSERLLFCGQRKFGGRSYCAHHLAPVREYLNRIWSTMEQRMDSLRRCGVVAL